MKYINYLWHAKTRYAVHSPFIYSFINETLRDKKKYPCYKVIESLRKELLRSGKTVQVNDFGAGSRRMNSTTRSLSDIARFSLMKPANAQLLFRIAKKNQPACMLELGTSLGITACYLASASEKGKIITIEGSEKIQDEAREVARSAGLGNIEFVNGNFDEKLPELLSSLKELDLVLIDGNHRKDPVLRYFKMVMEKTHNNSVIIIDDIHWSDEMEESWEEIKKHEKVSVTIDLFYMGIIFLKKELHKEHYILRY